MGATASGILALVVAIMLTTMPVSREAIARMLDSVRHPSDRRRRLTMLVVFAASLAFLLVTAWEQSRDFVPKFHDEFMHLLQIRMLAEGRLWTAAHPLADFFDTFHVLVRPVYASIYFPGTALLYLPATWLGLPGWVTPLVAAAASAALLYRVLCEFIDGVAGLLGAVMLLSLSMFRFLSLVVMSHGVIMLLGLAIVWAYLNWRRTKSPVWAAAAGAAMGWAAITRPFDALAYATPVGVAVVFALAGDASHSRRRRGMTVVLIAVAALPFIALQLVLNRGVTGRWLQTPYQLYAEQDSPRLEVGFATGDANADAGEGAAATTQRDRALQSTLPQKQRFYDEFLRPQIDRHRLGSAPGVLAFERIPLIARTTLPPQAPALMLAWPVLFLAGRGRTVAAAVLWAMLPVYLILYAMFPFLLPHYAVVPAPAVLCGLLLAKRGIEQRLPADSAGRRAGEVFLTTALALLALGGTTWVNRELLDDGHLRPAVWFAAKQMPAMIEKPAIVLFRFTPGVDDVHDEPVYNVDTVNPDDAPVIRAHDLGVDRDRALFDYYAARQPGRVVYLFVRPRAGEPPTPPMRLGTVAELAARLRPASRASSMPAAMPTSRAADPSSGR